MNILQNILGLLFRKYRLKIIRKEQEQLFKKIITSLPENFSELKTQVLSLNFLGLADWVLYPDFKFVYFSYHGNSINTFKRRGDDFKISGLKIFSKKNQCFEDIEMLIQDHLFDGIKITNSNYQLGEFDLDRIDNTDVTKTDFSFPPTELDNFYESLGQEIKNKLNPDDIFDIDFNNRTFYAFYDLEDGNYLAVDKKLKVYSLIHDARPMATSMKISFEDILNDIKNNAFDKEKHIEERYKNSK